MQRADVEEWVARYEKAWRTPGTAALTGIFTEDATYRMSPYEDPVAGIEAIAELWERERRGPDEEFTMTSRAVAVDGDTAVVRVEVSYGHPQPREYRDLWIMTFASDGRCAAFEEWPFSPQKAW